MARRAEHLVTGEEGVDTAGRALAVPDRDGRGPFRGHCVAAGKNATVVGPHRGGDANDAVDNGDIRHVFQEREVAVLAEGQHYGVRAEFFDFSGGLGETLFVESHLLDHQALAVVVADRREPPDRDALFEGLFEFFVVSGHLLAVSTVDDDRVTRVQTARGARRVERRVAATVDHDTPSELWWVAVGDVVEIRHGVEDARGVARRYGDASRQLGAHTEVHGVEAALQALAFDVVDGVVELHVHTEIDDSVDLGVQHVSRKSIRGDAVAHHAAESVARVDKADLVTEAAQVVRGAQSCRARADDEHALVRVNTG